MRKKLCYIILGIFLIGMFLYIGGKVYFSDLKTLAGRWDIDIPKGTKIEEYHTTGPSFYGDGHRFMILTCKDGNMVNSIFDPKKMNNTISTEGRDLIKRTYNSFKDKTLNKLTINDRLKSKTVKKNNNYLLIVFEEESSKYYLFDEIK